MKVARAKRGQFVIIAVLLVAIMLVSIGAVMHNALTYYRHEPWEEYTTLIGNIELNSQRLLEISLVAHPGDIESINQILNNWQLDLLTLYPGVGISLTYSGLHVADSSAKANFELEITSIGLRGYKFSAEAFSS